MGWGYLKELDWIFETFQDPCVSVEKSILQMVHRAINEHCFIAPDRVFHVELFLNHADLIERFVQDHNSFLNLTIISIYKLKNKYSFCTIKPHNCCFHPKPLSSTKRLQSQ